MKQPESEDGIVRCSLAVRKAGLDPTGTATHVRGFVVLEWPLPWPRKIETISALAPLFELAGALGLRVQLAHEIDPRVHRGRVLIARRGEGTFRTFDTAGWMLSDLPAGSEQRRLALVRLAVDALRGKVAPDPGAVIPQLLICTHGARDVCCGNFGMQLATAFAAARPAVAMWRTSHLGGHRFAPTALTLPDGHMWAFLDLELLCGIVDRSADPAALAAGHYRGCTATPPDAQFAERAAFCAQGWPLLDLERSTGTEPVAGNGDRRRAWCVVERPGGGSVRYEGVVVANRQIHLPACGSIDATVLTGDSRIEDVAVSPA